MRDIFEIPEEKLFAEINEHPKAKVITSKVPVTDANGEVSEKRFKYVYVE